MGVDPSEGPDVLREYRRANGYPWTVAVGERPMLERYNVLTSMTKFGIDRQGNIALRGTHTAEDAAHWDRVFQDLSRA